ILALKPVTFQYNSDKTNTPRVGLIAEDVAEVSGELVISEKNGKPLSVGYEDVKVRFLNKFLKEHGKIEEQETTAMQQRKDFEAAIARQQSEIEALTATVKQQASQIQKVSAQLEVSKAAPQTVVNNR